MEQSGHFSAEPRPSLDKQIELSHKLLGDDLDQYKHPTPQQMIALLHIRIHEEQSPEQREWLERTLSAYELLLSQRVAMQQRAFEKERDKAFALSNIRRMSRQHLLRMLKLLMSPAERKKHQPGFERLSRIKKTIKQPQMAA